MSPRTSEANKFLQQATQEQDSENLKKSMIMKCCIFNLVCLAKLRKNVRRNVPEVLPIRICGAFSPPKMINRNVALAAKKEIPMIQGVFAETAPARVLRHLERHTEVSSLFNFDTVPKVRVLANQAQSK